MKILKAKLTGIAPLLMHNGDLANPLNPFSQQMKKISSKRKKTDEDTQQMMRIEWRGSLYTVDKKVVFPGHVLEATLISAAKKNRRGQSFLAGVFSADAHFPLEYSGPKSIDDMQNDPAFSLDTTVRIKQSRILRRRPKFTDWSVEVAIKYDESQVNREEVIETLKIAGDLVGFGDWRPKYGRFTVKILKD